MVRHLRSPTYRPSPVTLWGATRDGPSPLQTRHRQSNLPNARTARVARRGESRPSGEQASEAEAPLRGTLPVRSSGPGPLEIVNDPVDPRPNYAYPVGTPVALSAAYSRARPARGFRARGIARMWHQVPVGEQCGHALYRAAVTSWARPRLSSRETNPITHHLPPDCPLIA
jgi:hypothetical protein